MVDFISDFPLSTSQLFNCLQISAEFIKNKLPPASISIVLGSGLSNFYKKLLDPIEIPFSSIPFMPVTTVKGHVSVLYYGLINSTPVYCWGGRLHGYEGYSNYQISYISHLSAFLSCHTLLVTNASGSAIRGSRPGDIILVKNHINHYGKNPLDTYIHSIFRDLHAELTYDEELIEFAKKIASENTKFNCHEGTYFWVRGPCFETPFEIECYNKLGGELFGMSTIPEVLAAQAHGMRVLVTAVVANLACGLSDEKLTHELVNQNISNVQEDIEQFFVRIVTELPQFSGEVRNAWVKPVVQNSLIRKRVKISDCDIETAAEWLMRIEKNKKKIEVLVVANSDQAPGMLGERRFMLSDVPNAVVLSNSAKHTEIIIGDLGDRRIAVVLTNDMEGLNIYESLFLLKVFNTCGVFKVHYIFPAFHDQGHYGVADYLAFRLHGRACWPRIEPAHMTKSGENYVLAFAGPTIPSKAEFTMCERLGFIASISSMAVLSTACCLSIDHSASFYGASKIQPVSLENLEWVLKVEYPLKMNVVVPNLLGDTRSPSSPEELQDLARSLKKYPVSVTFVLPEVSARSFFKVVQVLNFDSLPFTLYFTDEGVLLIEGYPVMMHEGNHSQMMYPYFLSNLLGVDKIVILDLCKAVDNRESWIRVTKHCGIAFYNPLFGKNVNDWGVRFPDLASAYEFNPGWQQKLKDAGVESCDGGVIFTSPERPLATQSALKIAEFLQADGVVQYGTYPVIISQHKPEDKEPRKVVYYAAPKVPERNHVKAFAELVKELARS